MLVLSRWSELCVSVPESSALPPSKTAKTVVEALLTTLNARVELALSGPHTLRREYR
jgi:hypothetical protein